MNPLVPLALVIANLQAELMEAQQRIAELEARLAEPSESGSMADSATTGSD